MKALVVLLVIILPGGLCVFAIHRYLTRHERKSPEKRLS